MQTTPLWNRWQDLLEAFAPAFTTPGLHRFGEWLTGLALNDEEHTITQSLIALDRPDDWKALESFAETGAWDAAGVRHVLAQLLSEAPQATWHGYHIWAGDDTKVHRDSAGVWGTCTFHEYTARCPNRASTVRAHNWVVLGALFLEEEQASWFLPLDAQLYCRASQLPAVAAGATATLPFHTKNELLVGQLQDVAVTLAGKHLAVFDGGLAHRSVVRPLVLPEGEQPRIEFVTRLRHDARLRALPPPPETWTQRGPKPKWGKPLPPPRCGGRWPGAWQEGTAWIYGRRRQVRWKEVVCQWRVLGHEVPVKAVVAEVEGYSQRFTLVTSAVELTGLEGVVVFAARFRQEDGFRDLKQRLGWEEGRAWTRLPIERTTQAVLTTLSLLRLLALGLEASGATDWWIRPPWRNPAEKTRPSVLDVGRLLRGRREEMRAGLSAWLGDEGKKVA